MKTINNCTVIKAAIEDGAGTPEVKDGKCLGYSHVRTNIEDDEPIDKCKRCKFNVYYKEGEEE